VFVQEMSVDELKARFERGDELTLLDIRSEAEVLQGVLPKSEHLPMHLIPLRANELPRDRDVVLYCRSGARSFHACAFLMQQGFRNVINLRGGIIDWARHGYEILPPSRGAPA
jgi:rhodanese-related sulfurtransferase